VQHPAAGAPPLPAQMKSGLPSAAAFCLPSQMVGYQAISIQRDSPGCGLSILCNSSNWSDGSGFKSSARSIPAAKPTPTINVKLVRQVMAISFSETVFHSDVSVPYLSREYQPC